MLEAEISIVSYEPDARRAKKLQLYLENISNKAYVCTEYVQTYNYVELYQPDIVLFSFIDEESIQFLEQIFAFEPKQIVAILLENAEAHDYKKMIEMGVAKFILRPLSAAKILDEIILLSQSKALFQQSNKLLLKEKEYLQEMDRFKDSLLTLFSHELKTPLNAIINFSKHSYKIINSLTFSKKERLLYEQQEINKGAKTIYELVDNIIMSMKVRSGDVDVQIEEISLYAMMQEIMHLFKDESNSIRLQNAIAKDFMLQSDKKLWKVLLVNLYTNALKYANTRALISLKLLDHATFILSVEDDGAGFAESENVFGLFEQGDKDVITRSDTGCGVGLYLVKEICTILGYNVTIETSQTLGGAAVKIKGKRKHD